MVNLKHIVIKGLWVSAIILLWGCGNNEELPIGKSSAHEVVKTVSLDTFSEYPQEIEGCSCFFATTIEDLNSGKFIYLNDLATYSFISIDKKMVRLSLVKKDTLPGNNHRFIYNSEDFELTIETRKDTTFAIPLLTGTIRVKTKDGRVFRTKCYGECGC